MAADLRTFLTAGSALAAFCWTSTAVAAGASARPGSGDQVAMLDPVTVIATRSESPASWNSGSVGSRRSN